MTPALFLGFLAVTYSAFAVVARRFLPPRTSATLLAGLAVWLVYVGTLSRLGVVSDPSLRPPGIAFIVVPVLIFIPLVVVRSPAAGRIAQAVPLWLLIAFQTYRVGIELFLHRFAQDGLVPKMLTFAGSNVDLWVGLSAPIVALLCNRGRSGRRVALAWNVLGLASLANVVVRSALTAPGPLHLIDAEVVNSAIGTFPYTFIAGFFAPLAVALHVLSFRALRAPRAFGAVAGLPA